MIIKPQSPSENLSAFTLIELLVVMAIISIALLAVVPAVIERSFTGSPVVDKFTEVINATLKEVEETGRIQTFSLFIGSGNIRMFDGEIVKIPRNISIQSIVINSEDSSLLESPVNVYPNGMMDYINLELSDGTRIESIPIVATIHYLDTGDEI